MTKKQINEAVERLERALADPNTARRDKKVLRRMKAVVGISSDALHTAHSVQSRVTNLAKRYDALDDTVDRLDVTTHRQQEELDDTKVRLDEMAPVLFDATDVINEMRESMANMADQFASFVAATAKTLEEFAESNASK